jgi:FAD:protein FMN transferase
MDYKFSPKLMGGQVEIILYDLEGVVGEVLSNEIYKEAKRLEKIFNFFDSSSELSKLNKKRKLVCSKDLSQVIKKAIVYCEKTQGNYDITKGKQILERKSGKELTPISCSYKDIKISGSAITISNEDVLIDLGSIAKGYITDKLAEFILDNGIESAFIDARGDMKIFGDHSETVEIQHPRDKSKTLFPIKLKNLAVATSGDYNQYYGSFENSHILNQKDLISVTVLAKNLTDADVFASAVFLSEKSKREKLIKENPGIKVLTIDKTLEVKRYNKFSKVEN